MERTMSVNTSKYTSEVGVIGTGFVGGSVIKWFKGCRRYSLSEGDFSEVDKQKYIFICLPTPFNELTGFDLTALYQNIDRLSGKKIIIIKSTVLPGTTEQLAKEYPQHTFFFNPEFLTAKTAWEDFQKPARQIMGYTDKKDRNLANDILNMLPLSEAQYVCPSGEAEMVKMLANCYLATRVVIANEFYDYCQKKGVDYENAIGMMSNGDKRIEPTHWRVFDQGYRGYSGYCFPKDMGALSVDSDSEIIKTAHKVNDKYIKATKK